ncbi:LysR family transcriptional regulator [Aquidulcibacter sp.]|uniref:LysR family transcriptional regulator n=1 Tax=Aquidulcibacter sp. TaxID=2052990 RepID=UPI003BA46AA8
MTTIELSELQVLVKVVQTGSFTRAAEQMGAQKAHLSRVMSKLERKLNARLLERSTRALTLTEVGRDIYHRAIGVLDAVEDTERAAQRFLGEPRGVLRLSCGVEFGMLAVSQWIGAYLAKYPEMRVDADYSARLVDIIHEGFDLAIRIGQLQDSQFVARKLGEVHYGLFASPSYLERHPRPEEPKALTDHDLLVFTTSGQNREWQLKRSKGEVRRIALSPRMSLNNSFAIRDGALAGLGIAQLPWILAKDQVDAGTLVQVLPDWQREPEPVHAIFPSSSYLTPKVRAFIDLAVAHFPDR